MEGKPKTMNAFELFKTKFDCTSLTTLLKMTNLKKFRGWVGGKFKQKRE